MPNFSQHAKSEKWGKSGGAARVRRRLTRTAHLPPTLPPLLRLGASRVLASRPFSCPWTGFRAWTSVEFNDGRSSPRALNRSVRSVRVVYNIYIRVAFRPNRPSSTRTARGVRRPTRNIPQKSLYSEISPLQCWTILFYPASGHREASKGSHRSKAAHDKDGLIRLRFIHINNRVRPFAILAALFTPITSAMMRTSRRFLAQFHAVETLHVQLSRGRREPASVKL